MGLSNDDSEYARPGWGSTRQKEITSFIYSADTYSLAAKSQPKQRALVGFPG